MCGCENSGVDVRCGLGVLIGILLLLRGFKEAIAEARSGFFARQCPSLRIRLSTATQGFSSFGLALHIVRDVRKLGRGEDGEISGLIRFGRGLFFLPFFLGGERFKGSDQATNQAIVDSQINYLI